MTARLGASVHELDGTGNAYDRHMECVESGRRREDVAPVHWRGHQAGLHRWRPGLSTALQRPVRPDDIVRAAQEVDVPWRWSAPRASSVTLPQAKRTRAGDVGAKIAYGRIPELEDFQ